MVHEIGAVLLPVLVKFENGVHKNKHDRIFIRISDIVVTHHGRGQGRGRGRGGGRGRLVEEEDSQQRILAHDQQLQVRKFNMYYSDEWQRNELSTVSASFL